jgi:hypothetical protein
MRARQILLLLTGAVFGAVTALGFVNTPVVSTAQEAGSSGLTGADLAEIQQLSSQYSQGSDLGEADMWVGVFAEDGIFRIADYGEWIGREQIRQYRTETFAPRPDGYTYRHWNSSWVILPDGNGGATGRVYWVGFDPSAEPLVITDSGIYHDTYARTPAGWRIQVRHARPDPASPDGGTNRPVNLQGR